MSLEKPSNSVLVDACVARNIGHLSTREELLQARKLLEGLRSGNVGALMTPKLRYEWRKHATDFMRRWLVGMESRRRVVDKPDRALQDFRSAVYAVLTEDHGLQAVLKDAHLTEAAIFYAVAVVSTDDSQRKLLRAVSIEYERLGRVQWFNPIDDHEKLANWIGQGGMDQESCKIVC